MIRLATKDDARGILNIYGPLCDTSYATFEIVPPSQEEMEERIKSITEKFPWYVEADSSGIHGYAYASPHKDRAAYRWSVNVSVYIAEGKRHAGLATHLYTRLFVELKERGFYNAYAGITLPNKASEGLHEKLGFKSIGIYPNVGFKLGKWHDVRWLYLPLRAHIDTPEEPLAGELYTASI